jgi:hypothetical protein
MHEQYPIAKLTDTDTQVDKMMKEVIKEKKSIELNGQDTHFQAIDFQLDKAMVPYNFLHLFFQQMFLWFST